MENTNQTTTTCKLQDCTNVCTESQKCEEKKALEERETVAKEEAIKIRNSVGE